MSKNQQKYFEELISKNRIAAAIEELIQLNLQPKFHKEVLQTKSRFEELNRKRGAGIISAENERLEHSQITDSLLSLIDTIWNDKSDLVSKIKKLPNWIKIIGFTGIIASIIGLIITIQSFSNEIQGCTNPVSCNFDPLALKDDGSCKPIPICNNDPCKGEVKKLSDDKCECLNLEKQPICKKTPIKKGKPPIEPQNKVNTRKTEKPTPVSPPCHPKSCNSDICDGNITIFDENICECILVEKQIMGCMEADADNFNTKANCDDGSCIIKMAGIVVNKENKGTPKVRIKIEEKVTETDKDGRFNVELPFEPLRHRNQVTVYYSLNSTNNNIITQKGDKNINIEI